ncbi:MAG: lysophospholipid acyltransferase family protein [Candidatus Paceibacterota bacterium]
MKENTRSRTTRIAEVLQFVSVSYPVFAMSVILYGVLRLTGRIRIRYPERWPRGKGRVIIAPNHPSLWEPMLLMLLFPWEGLRHPRTRIPWSTPDKGNYDRWYWALFRQRFIFVPRGKRKGELKALSAIIQKLKVGARVIMFGEGGRTARGATFCWSQNKAGRVRTLQHGLSRAACDSGATIVPIWISGAEKVLPVGCGVPRMWRCVTITIGEPYTVERVSSKDPQRKDRVVAETEKLTTALLELADEQDE